MVRKITLYVLVFLLVPACTSLREIQFVDISGVPIKEVLVIAEERPFLFKSFKRSVGLSDDNGLVNMLDQYDRMLIYKPGYYPIVNGSMIPGAPAWARRPVGSSVKLFPITFEKKEIITNGILAYFEGSENKVEIKDDRLVGKVSMFYDETTGSIDVKTLDGWELVEADKFYFDYNKYVNKNKVRESTRIRSIVFFIENDKGENYKVLVGQLAKGRLSGRRFAKFDVIISSGADFESAIYPNFNGWNEYAIDQFYIKGEPELFLDGECSQLRLKIEEYLQPSFLGYPSSFYELN